MTGKASARVAWLSAALGAALYALLAFGVLLPTSYPYFGVDLYDAYFTRLQEGRFDLPMRMLRNEGHYAPDGTGVLYHGVAPLLTRLGLAPFVTLSQFPTAAFSVWLWAVIGTGFYHLSLHQIIARYAGPLGSYPATAVAAIIGAAVWLCSPGLLLSVNSVLYHEPIAIAYAAMAAAVFILLRFAIFGLSGRAALVPLALLAGVLLHSRPHLAVGLYAGIAVLMLFSLWRGPARPFLASLSCLAILAAVALSFMQLNITRFGSATEAHGGFATDTASGAETVQFGPVYFGTDYAVTGRGVAFREHGRFHPARILPNLAVYTADFPAFGPRIAEMHRDATEARAGLGFIEAPRFGMVFLWPFWIVLMFAGLALGRPRFLGGRDALPLLVTTGVAAGLMLAYPTIAFRYRFDLWPFVMTLCLLSLPGLLARLGPKGLNHRRLIPGSAFLVLTGALFSGVVALPYSASYQEEPGRTYQAWDASDCARMIAHRNYAPDDVARICVDPDTVFAETQKG